MGKSGRSRKWTWTINNPTAEDRSEIQALIKETVYLVMGQEKETTIHWHGYCYMPNALTLKGMKTKLSRAHLDMARNVEKWIEYCKKDGKWREWGTKPKQGKRNDIETVTDAITKEALDYGQAIARFPAFAMKYPKGMQTVCESVMQHRDRNKPPEIIWIWGSTGQGKTRWAFDKYGDENCYIKNATKWWQDYHQQKCIIIDDFNPTKWDYEDLLRLLDRYPYLGETKGGSVKINSPHIVITCQKQPRDCWRGLELEQIERRISNILHLGTEVAGNTISATSGSYAPMWLRVAHEPSFAPGSNPSLGGL